MEVEGGEGMKGEGGGWRERGWDGGGGREEVKVLGTDHCSALPPHQTNREATVQEKVGVS